MHEDPLKLLPFSVRRPFLEKINRGHGGRGSGSSKKQRKIAIKGDLNPACRYIFNEYMEKYDGIGRR